MRTRNWTWAPIAAALLSPVAAFGWGDGGHEIVAAIAFPRLNAPAKAEVTRLLAISITPAGMPEPSDPAKRFMHASHWADDVKNTLSATRNEHFVDFPFSPDGTPLPTDLPDPVNIIKALTRHVNTLQTSSDDQEKAKALRFVIHYVGDIHQPLHCSTRVTSAHPHGDRGGNDFPVKVKHADGQTSTVKLHSFWDGGLETFPREGAHFSPPPDAEIPPAMAIVLAGNPDTDPQISAGGPADFLGWATESKKLAKSTAYDTLKPNRKASAAYRSAGVRVARRRVAWAGYRLATLLNSIWP